MDATSPLALTRKLIAFNTANPPGTERSCAEYLGKGLEEAGLRVAYREFDEERTSLVAFLQSGSGPAICFSGHLDTVPPGSTPWKSNPLAGETDGEKVLGRGSSDMKSGVAAMVTAALRLGRMKGLRAPLLLILTAGEETGCEGASFLARQFRFPCEVGAMVVGEPTGNYPLIGHKGALWVEARTQGAAAHGSTPEKGVNAIFKAAELVLRLRAYPFKAVPHPLLGGPTLNVGTFSGGSRINIVPDRAVIGIDIRTVPGQRHEDLVEDLRGFLGKETALERLVSAESIVTDPGNEWVQEVFRIMTGYLDETPAPRAATYFTDASALVPALGRPPTVLLGPGEPETAHKTDEFCYIHKIEAAAEAYLEIARHWCGP
jgi:succinyl-diaminopimelate desuccinylase